MTLFFVDARGESYSAVVPIGEHGVPLGRFIYLAFEVGTGDRTRLRIILDGKVVALNELPYRVVIDPLLDMNGVMVMGADLNEKNCGTFDEVEFAAYNSSLTSDETDRFTEYFRRDVKAFIEFSGNKWLRTTQGNTELHGHGINRPIYRTIPPGR